MDNFIYKSDSYKVTHWPQYEPGTEFVYSYFESRGGYAPFTEMFGLQRILKQHFVGRVLTHAMVDDAKVLLSQHFGRTDVFNEAGWRHIVDQHGGCLPISIKAAPEGSRVPVKNALVTVENTCPHCFWVTNYCETLLSQLWYPMAVATQSRMIKDLIRGYLESTGDVAGLDFKLHDFGFRGVEGVEAAGIGGLAHLVNFKGTDTLQALDDARKYYNASTAVGFSIPASEHSTITSWGPDRELDACRNMLERYQTGLVACVSDSFDVYKLCRYGWGKALKELVLTRDGTLVVRPDSGDPATVVFDIVEILGECIGYVRNAKGFKVLDSHVRVIQGDGVNRDSINEILKHLRNYGWSADNVAFGMGGALLQKLDRDTHKCAFKCSHVAGKGFDRDVWKDPITDAGKVSKRGRLMLTKSDDGWQTRNLADLSDASAVLNRQGERNMLSEVFRDGRLLVDVEFDTVRNVAEQGA